MPSQNWIQEAQKEAIEQNLAKEKSKTEAQLSTKKSKDLLMSRYKNTLNTIAGQTKKEIESLLETAKNEGLIVEEVPGREFHYIDSTNSSCLVIKRIENYGTADDVWVYEINWKVTEPTSKKSMIVTLSVMETTIIKKSFWGKTTTTTHLSPTTSARNVEANIRSWLIKVFLK